VNFGILEFWNFVSFGILEIWNFVSFGILEFCFRVSEFQVSVGSLGVSELKSLEFAI
jgi:hypothetical protein